MKEIDKIIEKKLKHAVEQSVPDILPALLQQIEEEGENIQMKDKKTRKFLNIKKLSLAIAASIVLLLGSYGSYAHFTPESVIGLDVNPSIELSVNRSNKVLKVSPLNKEGITTIGDMKLKNVDLDIVINALIGSMVKNGFIDEIKNSILITVDSNNHEKGITLRDHLSEEVNKLLETYSVKGAILSQTSETDKHIKDLSDQYDISYGKALLIDKLIKEDPRIEYEKAALLPINDLNLLISNRTPKLQGLSTSGSASRKGYIGEDKATSIALGHANLNESHLQSFEIEIDYEDGRMIYELEFKDKNGTEYEYEIDAKSGNILEYEVEYKGGGKDPIITPDLDTDKGNKNHEKDYIGAEKAIEIALNHAGLKRSDIRKLEWELDTEDGYLVYEVEFDYDIYEYEYDIDVYTGKIIDWEKEIDD